MRASACAHSDLGTRNKIAILQRVKHIAEGLTVALARAESAAKHVHPRTVTFNCKKRKAMVRLDPRQLAVFELVGIASKATFAEVASVQKKPHGATIWRAKLLDDNAIVRQWHDAVVRRNGMRLN